MHIFYVQYPNRLVRHYQFPFKLCVTAQIDWVSDMDRSLETDITKFASGDPFWVEGKLERLGKDIKEYGLNCECVTVGHDGVHDQIRFKLRDGAPERWTLLQTLITSSFCLPIAPIPTDAVLPQQT